MSLYKSFRTWNRQNILSMAYSMRWQIVSLKNSAIGVDFEGKEVLDAD